MQLRVHVTHLWGRQHNYNQTSHYVIVIGIVFVENNYGDNKLKMILTEDYCKLSGILLRYLFNYFMKELIKKCIEINIEIKLKKKRSSSGFTERLSIESEV